MDAAAPAESGHVTLTVSMTDGPERKKRAAVWVPAERSSEGKTGLNILT